MTGDPGNGMVWRKTARSALVAGVLATVLAGCSAMSGLGLGSSEAPPVMQHGRADASAASATELEKATEYWGRQAAKNPRDGAAALNYAKNLKAMGRKKEALAVLQHSHIYNAQNREHLSEYGRLALEFGQISAAQQLLERADDPAKPDWRVISARGTVLAKQERYKDAIPFFERARQLAPDQASVLNNLAMAYALDGEAQKAEQLLRQASQANGSDARVRHNLTLVLGLQGKYDEAKQVAGADLSPDTAQANVDYLRSIVRAEPMAQPPPTRARDRETPATALARAEPMKASREPVVREHIPASPKSAGSARPALDPERVIKAAQRAESKRAPQTASAVATGSLEAASDPDQIIRAALQAEAAKTR